MRHSKTDPEARGQVVGNAHGQDPLTDPIAALDAWLAFRGTKAGPVFTSLRGRRPSLQRIFGTAVSNIVKERARAGGLSGDRVSGHSLRVGLATSAALAGVVVERIAAKPGIAGSTSSSSATSAPSKPCKPPPAATSDSEDPGEGRQGTQGRGR